MIEVLGFKRIVAVLILVAVNAAMAAGIYAYLLPEQQVKERQLRSLNSTNSRLQSDIDRIQVSFEQIQEQKGEFEALQDAGFFNTQGRREAEQRLLAIQEQAGIIRARANIEPGRIEDHPEAEKAGYKVLTSPIRVEIEALDDSDVFRYMRLVEDKFPGHITFTNINLERVGELSRTVLRSIAAGDNPVLVEATIEMDWRTMISEDEVINRQAGRRR